VVKNVSFLLIHSRYYGKDICKDSSTSNRRVFCRFPPVIEDPNRKGAPFQENNNVPIVKFFAGVGYEELKDDVVPFREVMH